MQGVGGCVYQGKNSAGVVFEFIPFIPDGGRVGEGAGQGSGVRSQAVCIGSASAGGWRASSPVSPPSLLVPPSVVLVWWLVVSPFPPLSAPVLLASSSCGRCILCSMGVGYCYCRHAVFVFVCSFVISLHVWVVPPGACVRQFCVNNLAVYIGYT